MEAEEPKSFIDRVEAYLKEMPKQLHSISNGVQIQIIDTPRIWGLPMNQEGVAKQAKESVQALADTIYEMIAGAEHKVDILSLNPADGVFLAAIKRALKALAKSDNDVTIRFLFGWVPTRDTVAVFRADLADFCEEHQISTHQFTILIGQYYSYKMFWNHAKIVAVDGKVALVGGHNLWDSAYGKYPPVHDISVYVEGEAAEGAHGFADFLWDNGGEYLEIWGITGKHQVIKRASQHERDYHSLDMQVELSDMSTVRGSSELRLLKESGASSESEESEDVIESGGEHPVKAQRPPLKLGRVMSLGRCGGLEKGKYNASDIAKRVIILNARKSLKICQQDLLFAGTSGESKHLVCQWIAEALLSNPELVVQIVVSPIDASGAGDQYSWGSGAIGTYKLICQMIRQTSTHGMLSSEAIDRLFVAPFCFTKVMFEAEGVDYCWPGVPEEVWAGRFGTTVPKPSGTKYPPAPGNHAKVFIADDSVFYVGSDNLYPHDLAEFGYLIEGDPVRVLLDSYWDEVWKYSKGHCVGGQSSITISMGPQSNEKKVEEIFKL